jgi:hypothetical protein
VELAWGGEANDGPILFMHLLKIHIEAFFIVRLSKLINCAKEEALETNSNK